MRNQILKYRGLPKGGINNVKKIGKLFQNVAFSEYLNFTLLIQMSSKKIAWCFSHCKLLHSSLGPISYTAQNSTSPTRWVLGQLTMGKIQDKSQIFLVKFIYSEKATNFCKISTVDLSYESTVKSTVEISQNFLTFSEYLNFNIVFIRKTHFLPLETWI